MKGKVCLVTGGTSGVGRAVAAGLAALGAEVVILARDRERGEETVRALREGNARVSLLHCDLADLGSVRRAAAEFRSSHARLDVLAGIAGIIAWKRRLSLDGYELAFATNHLGHVLLTAELLGLMERSGSARVLSVAGAPSTLSRARLDLDDIAERRSTFAPGRVAVQTMLARVVWTFEAARRYAERGITANVFFPGFVRSRLQRGLPLPLRLAIGLVEPFLSPRCPTGVFACSSAELEGTSGRFIVGRRSVVFSNPSCGQEVAERLWTLGERLAKVL